MEYLHIGLSNLIEPFNRIFSSDILLGTDSSKVRHFQICLGDFGSAVDDIFGRCNFLVNKANSESFVD